MFVTSGSASSSTPSSLSLPLTPLAAFVWQHPMTFPIVQAWDEAGGES